MVTPYDLERIVKKMKVHARNPIHLAQLRKEYARLTGHYLYQIRKEKEHTSPGG